MAKILVWNLQRFTGTNLVPEYWVQPNLNEPERLQFLQKVEYPNAYGLMKVIGALDPDIFVVIEVQSEQNNLGQPVGGGGKQGLLLLLSWMRRFHDANWCLVPALQLNAETDPQIKKSKGKTYVEGIGVYYRSDRLAFQGPWMWPNGPVDDIIKRSCPINYGGLRPGPYPPSWAGCLPDQNYFAGQYLFEYEDEPVYFTQERHRRPWLTRFVEPNGRAINLMSVHLPPNNAPVAMEAIKNIIEKVPEFGNVPANTVSVIAGDFNIDMNNPETRKVLYYSTRTPSFQWAIPDQTWGTMLRPNCFGGAQPNDYMESHLLDNAIVRYGSNMSTSKNYPYNSMIVNPVEGNSNHNPVLLSTMDKSLLELHYIQNNFLKMATFSSSANYGHIAHPSGLSDHLPIYFEV